MMLQLVATGHGWDWVGYDQARGNRYLSVASARLALADRWALSWINSSSVILLSLVGLDQAPR